MVSSSKILTVSYGTFSCTAEGFEDPLAVVKESTNFFRGVVREDRFFGAEPPQFDPELAAQLMQAQVSADAQSGRLVLRGPLADAAMPAAAPAGADVVGPDAERGMEKALSEAAERAAAEAAAEEAELQREAEAAAKAATKSAAESTQIETQAEILAEGDDSLSAEAAFFAAESAAPALDAFDDDYDDEPVAAAAAPAAPVAGIVPASDDSVAAKLRRIRAVVSGGAVAATAPDVSEDADQDGEDTVAAVSAMLGTLDMDAPEVRDAARDEDADDADDMQIDLSVLQGEDWDDEEDVAEDATDAELEAELDAPVADAPFALTKAFAAAPDHAEEAEIEAEVEAAEPAAAAPAKVVRVAHEASAEAATDTATDTAPEAAKPSKPRRVRVVKVSRAAFDAAVATGALEEVRQEPAQSSLSADDEADLARELEAVKAELAAGLEDEWDEVDDLDQIRAAADVAEAETPVPAETLLAELEAETEEESAWDDEDLEDDLEDEDFDDEAWGDDDWDDEDDDEEDLAASAAARDALLDDEDDEDDDLAEDFAEAFDAPLDEADEDGDDQDWDDQASDDQDGDDQDGEIEEMIRVAQQDVRKAVKLSSPARVMLTETSVEDNDTSRILNETNTQLEEPEGNRRRSAIAHLRAAVAATRADRLLGRKKDAEEQAQPYREDLADVVRPRRPAPAPQGATERPAAEAPLRPAPLKLVAEQRVNETADAPEAPLRPRRVTLADLEEQAPAGVQGDFASYAESVGAHDLPDLLEAAASYLSYIEGRAQFSRPQLMTKVRQVDGEDSSREDRLRSFGQLLRDGKIEKTGGGRFTVSDRISFKPSARAAG
ncbi:hypothetical protein [Salipiger sp. PrR002]|uniref:hypothetical protein n=1 Tax=Salipiger sp. PrR002 TaxID=2706489 RepID=UPI0013B9CCDD|nr:hypothetical protein [Salipiger sp. PrR002]NDV98684.1 hypothetical protein [Salipiger sp. PrR002]NDW57520.1 hypothetical protein [Salipiger sp. PrR004]